MEPFRFKDLEALAIALPDMVDFYRRSGDFDGELACIDRLLASDRLSRSMRTRLELERVIAGGMREDYQMDRAAFLARIRRKYPLCDDTTVDLLLASGHIDTILRGGELRFQNAAVSNALNCCKKLLEDQAHPETPFVYEEDSLLRANARLMRERGWRAFRYRVRMSLTVDEEAQRAGKRIRVWLPMPAKCAEQTDIVLHSASENVSLSGGKQPTAFFEEIYTPGKEFFVEFSYTHRVPWFDLNTADVCAASRGKPPHLCSVPAVMKQGGCEPLFGVNADCEYTEGKEGSASARRKGGESDDRSESSAESVGYPRLHKSAAEHQRGVAELF